MRLFRLEIKRVLKSRRTKILLAIAIVLSVLMAIIPIYFDCINRPNADGTVSELSGFASIEYKRPYYATTYGEVTPQKVADALRTYQNFVTEYGGEENIPLEVYINDLLAINPLIRGLVEAYADPYTGYAAELMDIDPDDVETFYYSSHCNCISSWHQRNADGSYSTKTETSNKK